jgi:hypothetical protein
MLPAMKAALTKADSATIIAMINEDHRSSVKEKGFSALCVLARDEAMREIIAKQGGISCVMHGMSSNKKDASLQHTGCATLCILAASDVNAEHMGREGVVPLVLGVMHMHRVSGFLPNDCCSPLEESTESQISWLKTIGCVYRNPSVSKNGAVRFCGDLQTNERTPP